MDPRSEALLAHVHPDLAKVMRMTTQACPFEVIQGLRTPSEEAANVAKGASQTMHSRHLPNKAGLACAVDVAALVDGHISWVAAPYSEIARNVLATAKALNIPVEWGGAWASLRDLGHWQLPWKEYP